MRNLRGTLLGRGKNHHPEPTTTQNLRALIDAQSPIQKCTCDLCLPKLYSSAWNCPTHPNHRAKLEKDAIRNEYGNECYSPMKLSKVVRYEVMHLTRTAIEYFDRPEKELNNKQLQAARELNAWIQERVVTMLFSEGKDLEKLVSATVIQRLWHLTDELFFRLRHSVFAFPVVSHAQEMYRESIPATTEIQYQDGACIC